MANRQRSDPLKSLSAIRYVERELTAAELARVQAGFDLQGREHGNPPGPSLRLTCVALDGEAFIGCASGLRHDQDTWFFITDLFVEKAYRRKGIGAALLGALEAQAAALGVKTIWTWTAGYEAPGFYLKQGYQIFCEQEDYYPTGHSRLGLRKAL
jgi:GNAT superfamily N-acetyltransferase